MARIAVLSTNDGLISLLRESLAQKGHEIVGFLSRSELSLEIDPFDLIAVDLRPVSRTEFGAPGNVCSDIMLHGRCLHADRAIVLRDDPEYEGLRSVLSVGAMGYARISSYGLELTSEDVEQVVRQVDLALASEPYEAVDFYAELPDGVQFCHSMVESIDVPLIGLTRDEELVFMNLSALARFGYIPQQVHRRDWKLLLADSNNPTKIQSFLDDVRHTLGGEVELTCRTRSGEEFPALLNGARMFPSGGLEWRHITVSIQDQSQAKRMEQQILHLQKMESVARLAGGIAHDFNNILGAIMGHASLLEMEAEPESPYLEDIRKILRATQQGADLAMQLLGFARGGKHNVKVLRLNEVLESTLAIFPITFHDNLHIERDLDKETSAIEGDESQWKQVLTNLFLNARDAMPEGGTLSIGLRNVRGPDIAESLTFHDPFSIPSSMVELTIGDTGSGMTADVRQRAFDPFFTTKEKGRGTGLGLSMVYGILKSHGGHVLLESEPGVGTTFRLYVPASSKEAAREEEQTIADYGGDETILIVDDQDSVLEVAQRSLSLLGYRPILAHDGVEGLEIFKKRQGEIDLVLSDIVMPRMGGKELFDELLKVNPDVRVLFMSGYSQENRAGDLLKSGARGFLPKPYDLTSLANAVRSALDA